MDATHYQLDPGIEVFDLKLASMKQSFFHLIGMVKKIKPDLIFFNRHSHECGGCFVFLVFER